MDACLPREKVSMTAPLDTMSRGRFTRKEKGVLLEELFRRVGTDYVLQLRTPVRRLRAYIGGYNSCVLRGRVLKRRNIVPFTDREAQDQT